MRKHITRLAVVLTITLLVPLAAPAGATGILPAASVALQTGGPDVDDVRVGTPAISETFRRNDAPWILGPTSSGDRSIVDGRLVISVTEADKLTWSIYDGSPDEFGDFYVEVDAVHLAGDLDNSFGIAFRMEDAENCYLFEINANGEYMFSKLVDNEWDTIVDWTKSTVLNTGRGSENSLGVLSIGDWIVLTANDKELKRIADDSFSKGWIGLSAASYDDGGVEAGFDNLKLWQASTSTAGGSIAGRGTGSSSASPTNATVTSETLNVRSGPSTAYSILSALRRGDRVQMIGRTADSQWVKIAMLDKPQAWLAARYLSPDKSVQSLPVATPPPPPPAAASRPTCRNEAYVVVENHIGRYITVQVSDLNFRVEGKVGDVPGRYYVTLNGTGRFPMAAQLPNGGSTNFDLYVEPTADRCANRTGCIALCQTLTIPFSIEN